MFFLSLLQYSNPPIQREYQQEALSFGYTENLYWVLQNGLNSIWIALALSWCILTLPYRERL